MSMRTHVAPDANGSYLMTTKESLSLNEADGMMKETVFVDTVKTF